MKKSLIYFLLVITTIAKAQNNELPETYERFSHFLRETMPELKVGYEFTECTKNINASSYPKYFENTRHMNGLDYIYLKAISFFDVDKGVDFGEIEKRLFLGYINGPNGSVLIITAKETNIDSLYHLSSPELMLYNKYGNKISQINLNRNYCRNNFSNFSITSNGIVREVSCIDSSEVYESDVYDIDSGKRKFEKNQRTEKFTIKFDTSGFEITNQGGVKINFKNHYQKNKHLDHPHNSFSYHIYEGEIVYPNHAVFKGHFELEEGFVPIIKPNVVGKAKFKNASGQTVEGYFCTDTVLCNFPKIYFGKTLIYNGIDDFEITKEDLINNKTFKSSDGNILSGEVLMKTEGGIRQYSFSGSDLYKSKEMNEDLKTLVLKSIVYIDLKVKSMKDGKIHNLTFKLKIK